MIANITSTSSRLSLFLALLCGLLLNAYTSSALAYDVEANSNGNKVYMLLLNDNPGAVYHSISISRTLPAFVSSATADIVPETVLGGKSDLAMVLFDVNPSASNGQTGDLVITVSGSAAGAAIEVVFTVPLTVASSAPTAQGFVGTGEPQPDPGGTDTDLDGVPDSLEIAYGSDPNSASSIPGQIDTDGDGVEDGSDPAPNDPCIPSDTVAVCDTDGDGVPDGNDPAPADPCVPDPMAANCALPTEVVPVLGWPALLLLGGLLALLGVTQTRRRSQGGAKS